MASQGTITKSSLMVNIIVGKISTVAGWVIACFFGLITLTSIFDNVKDGLSVVIFCLFVTGLGILAIINGRRTKKRIKRFKQYIEIISNQNTTNFDDIAQLTGQSVDFVVSDMRGMVERKYFVGAYIDINAHEIVFKNRKNESAKTYKVTTVPRETQAVVCKSCGASNQIVQDSTGECEYCGSAISANNV